MNIYIMSRGRAGKVNTLNWISEKWLDHTWLVVSREESEAYDKAHPEIAIHEVPKYVTNYSQKFQYILDGLPKSQRDLHEREKAIIIDDDLVFSVPHEYKQGSLVTVRDPNMLDGMWERIEELLDEYALVGVHPRQMGQHAPRPYVLNGRIICLQGVNRRKIGKVEVDQFPILADVVLNCTLLARGQANCIITTYFQDHGPCQAPGGCSTYRTAQMQRDAVRYLVRRFGPYVTEVERQTKDKWLANEEGVRYDYRCQWKQLYAAGVAHVLDSGKVPNPDKEAGRIAKTVE